MSDITDRLKELARAAADQNWGEFSMRVPADHARDADLVLLAASKEITSLRAELAEANKAATDMESALYEASAEFERLARANERLRGALGEVMEWIDAWEPGFVGTKGWEDTRAKIRAAIAGEGDQP